MSKVSTDKKLKGKDLITIGIFSAIYFVINFAFMLLGGIHPVLWMLMPGFIAVFAGIPFKMCIRDRNYNEKSYKIWPFGITVRKPRLSRVFNFAFLETGNIPFQLVIYKAILGITDGFNVFTTFIVAILSALFNGDTAVSYTHLFGTTSI